jgi:two-component system NtrC family response regulator
MIAGGRFPRRSLLPAKAKCRESIWPNGPRFGIAARHFVSRFAREMNAKVQASPDAADAIDAYGWPGNIRELENRIKRAVIMTDGKWVAAADLDLPESPDPEPNPCQSTFARRESGRPQGHSPGPVAHRKQYFGRRQAARY